MTQRKHLWFYAAIWVLPVCANYIRYTLTRVTEACFIWKESGNNNNVMSLNLLAVVRGCVTGNNIMVEQKRVYRH